MHVCMYIPAYIILINKYSSRTWKVRLELLLNLYKASLEATSFPRVPTTTVSLRISTHLVGHVLTRKLYFDYHVSSGHSWAQPFLSIWGRQSLASFSPCCFRKSYRKDLRFHTQVHQSAAHAHGTLKRKMLQSEGKAFPFGRESSGISSKGKKKH